MDFTRLFTFAFLFVSALTVHGKLRRDRRKRAYKHLGFQNCGNSNTSVIKVLHAAAHPMPIPTPGKLRLTFSFHISRPLPQNLSLKLTLHKFLFGYRIRIPCWNHIGSCTYRELCGLLSYYEETGCPRAFRRQRLPCHCPFKTGTYNINRLTLRIPSLTGMAAILAKGNYEVELRLYDDNTQDELSCLKVLFSMRRRRRKKGWFFKA